MKGIESDLADLEQALRKLEFEYEQFFSGNQRVLPMKAEDELKGLIRSYSGRAIQNPAHRFKFNNVVARYNSMKKVWERRVREMEEGRPIGRPKKGGFSPGKKEAPAPARRQEFQTSDIRAEESTAKEIFDTYKKLRNECGESTERLRYESFSRILAEKVEKLKNSKGCEKVEVRLRRENDKCRIMVRPLRDSD